MSLEALVLFPPTHLVRMHVPLEGSGKRDGCSAYFLILFTIAELAHTEGDSSPSQKTTSPQAELTALTRALTLTKK